MGGLIHLVWCVARQVVGEWVGRCKEWYAWRTLGSNRIRPTGIFSTVLLLRLKEHTAIRRVDLPPSSGGKGEEKNTTLLDPLERANCCPRMDNVNK